MELSINAFRASVREFIHDNLPADIAERTRRISFFENFEDKVAWNRVLFDKGWSMPQWPEEYGGCGWSPIQNHIFEQECFAADAPRVPFMGRYLIGPVIYTFGTEEMKSRFLPRILRAEDVWAQGFSEPNAGSDLASLRLRAERRGDAYVVNGQKIWTTDAHVASWIFLLARTEQGSERHRGLSFILVDLKSPGITIRPIPTIDGRHHVNEIFFEDVEVPVANLVGEEGKGWAYCHFLLNNERTTSAEIYWSLRELAKSKTLIDDLEAAGAARVSGLRDKHARLDMDARALEYSVLRILHQEKGEFGDDAIASTLKVRGAKLQQRITDLQLDIVAERGLRAFTEDQILAHDEKDTPLWPNWVVGKTSMALLLCGASVYGGSEEIQKNIIAKRGFDL